MKIIISISYICDEKIHFQRLDRANTVTINFKRNVLCYLAFIYGITTTELIFRGLNSVIDSYNLIPLEHPKRRAKPMVCGAYGSHKSLEIGLYVFYSPSIS